MIPLWRSLWCCAWGGASLAGCVLAFVALPADAIPPPPDRPLQTIVFPGNGCSILVEGSVLAYDQPVFAFSGRSADLLRLMLVNPDPALEFNLETASGLVVAAGIGFGSGDAQLRLPESGVYHLRVLIDGNAARHGRKANFQLRLAKGPNGELSNCAPAGSH